LAWGILLYGISKFSKASFATTDYSVVVVAELALPIYKKSMKRKIYTRSHNINLLKEIDNNGNQFSAKEHAYFIEKEFGNTVFRTKEALLRDYLSGNSLKLGALGFLIERITNNGYRNILSLGSGQCVLEYLLKLSLPEESEIIATDFDTYFIEKAKSFFPEITSVTFDFFKDDIISLQNNLNVKFDIAVFFGSAYVMDDPYFIKLFADLKKIGVKEIVDFHAGYMDLKDVIVNVIVSLLRPFARNSAIRRVFHKCPVDKYKYIGKFHGYSRNRAELRKLYRKAGFKLYKELSVPNYKYVAILK